MTTSRKELSAQEIFRAISTLGDSNKIFAAIRQGCKNVDIQGSQERFGQRYAQTKKNFFENEEKKMKIFFWKFDEDQDINQTLAKILNLFGSNFAEGFKKAVQAKPVDSLANLIKSAWEFAPESSDYEAHGCNLCQSLEILNC